MVSTANKALLGNVVENHEIEPEHSLSAVRLDNGNVHFYRNSDEDLSYSKDDKIGLKYFDSVLRLTVFEYTTDFVFIHAGVVAIDDSAIIIPGMSHSGKTSLVREFLKLGAEYYSDEYAMIGEDGMIYPYPRPLSIRDKSLSDEYEIEVSHKDLGAKVGTLAIRAGLVLFTKYESGAAWNPQPLSISNGILRLIPHVISIRKNTKNALSLLNLAFENARMITTLRDEAEIAAVNIINSLRKKIES